MNTFSGVVQIAIKDTNQALGSGIVIAQNTILTVRHVLKNGKNPRAPLFDAIDIEIVAGEFSSLVTDIQTIRGYDEEPPKVIIFKKVNIQ